MLVSIIAPAYNEEGNIAAFARAAAEAFRDLPEGWSCEVVFVDDGSRDATLEAMHAAMHDEEVLTAGNPDGAGCFLRDELQLTAGCARVERNLFAVLCPSGRMPVDHSGLTSSRVVCAILRLEQMLFAYERMMAFGIMDGS